MLDSQMVKEAGLEFGADVVGIGPLDRFEGAPPEMDPRHIAPRAKSMVAMAFRIPRGYMRGCEEGTQFFQYPSMGYGGINEVYAPTVLYNTARFIEDHGHEGIVYRNAGGRGALSDMTGKPGREESPELHQETRRAKRHSCARPATPGLPAPDVFIHFRLAAFVCGLGEIGHSKMFLTPQFGPMQRFAFILTDAELEPDPIYAGPKLCNNCMACAAHCPGHCIDTKEKIHVTVAGHDVSWGKLDEWKCFAYYAGANQASNPFLPGDAFKDIPDGDKIIAGTKDSISPEEFPLVNDAINRHYPTASGYNPPKCGGCLRACLSSMEKRGVLRNKFKNQFRDKTPWKMEA